jgi:hypothetical protein
MAWETVIVDYKRLIPDFTVVVATVVEILPHRGPLQSEISVKGATTDVEVSIGEEYIGKNRLLT